MDQTSQVQSKRVDFDIDKVFVDIISKHLPFDLILIGPTCCGKGTNANKFLQSCHTNNIHDVHVIRTGELLRAYSGSLENPDFVNKNIRTRMMSGNLVDPSTESYVCRREADFFLSKNPNGSLIWDGSPRDSIQAHVLAKYLLHTLKRKNVFAVHFSHFSESNNGDIKSEKFFFNELWKRAQERGREDDSKEVFETKKEIYKTETIGAIAVLSSNEYKIGVRNIGFDPNKNIDQVYECFVKTVRKSLRSIVVQNPKTGN